MHEQCNRNGIHKLFSHCIFTFYATTYCKLASLVHWVCMYENGTGLSEHSTTPGTIQSKLHDILHNVRLNYHETLNPRHLFRASTSNTDHRVVLEYVWMFTCRYVGWYLILTWELCWYLNRPLTMSKRCERTLSLFLTSQKSHTIHYDENVLLLN